LKTQKSLAFSLLFIIYLMIALPFQSCDPDDRDREVYKPNIYIYPIEKIELTVKLDFPKGGKILTSIPEYGTGWNVLVDTNGLIDNTYSYLFYESIQPDVWQRKKGWISETDDLESFFRKNLSDYGFECREIDDFIEHWIPRLDDYKYYSIYPQTKSIIEEVILLDFSKQPDNMLRLHYFISGHNQLPDALTPPTIDRFNREGYFVTEWGVVL